jgi:outer membrane protein TolC
MFDGYSNLNARKQAEELAHAEEEKLVEAELQASAEVWFSFFNYQAALKKLNYSKSYLSSANNSYELAFESYKSGLSSIIDVLDAQASLAQARSQLITSEEDLYMSLSNLSHATGKLYRKSVVNFEQETVNLNVTEY